MSNHHTYAKPKSFLIILLVVVSFNFSYSQTTSSNETETTSINKSSYGVELGFLNAGIFYEFRIARAFSLKNEFKFSKTYLINSSNAPFYFQPEIIVQPRWYYNLQKRHKKGNRTVNNSANFIGITGSYRPTWFSLPENTKYLEESVSYTVDWGLRRSFAENFHFEFIVGAGVYNIISYNKIDNPSNESSSVALINIRAQIGYRF